MTLNLKEITKTYQSGENSTRRTILNQLDLLVNQGDRIAIVGPSGSGKTTLLNLMGTLDRPDSGKMLFEEQDLSYLSDQELAVFRNEKIGFVFQMHHLLPQLTLLENILLPTLTNKKLQGKETLDRAMHLISRMGLANVSHQKPSQLSGGECQRTAVARALINRPKLILADEPTGALDHHSAFNLTDLLVELNKEEGLTLIVVTHSMDIAQKMNLIYSLEEGKLIPVPH
ncbi:MAG TPA: ABC transporter ATP-binding protein [Prolixibacteraceae bacterium]|nr:ABC transporter ATP-binding protein [Prolixibacteraceae bacterium]